MISLIASVRKSSARFSRSVWVTENGSVAARLTFFRQNREGDDEDDELEAVLLKSYSYLWTVYTWNTLDWMDWCDEGRSLASAGPGLP
jgi:hypothetical protein